MPQGGVAPIRPRDLRVPDGSRGRRQCRAHRAGRSRTSRCRVGTRHAHADHTVAARTRRHAQRLPPAADPPCQHSAPPCHAAAAARWGEIRLDPEATSLRRWARLLNDAATGPELLAGLPAWQDMTKVSEPLLGDRGLNPEVDTVGRSHCLTVQVAPEVSELVLTRLTRAYHTGANEVLLTALALALMHRRVMRGESDGAVLVNLEGHGRESLAPSAHVSRTAGCVTG